MTIWCVCCELTDPTFTINLDYLKTLNPSVEESFSSPEKMRQTVDRFIADTAAGKDKDFDPSQNIVVRTRDVLPTIEETIVGLGDACRLSSSTWLVATDLKVEQMWERLWPQVLAEKERLVILPVLVGAEWRLHSGSDDPIVQNWLYKHLAPAEN
jgi:hypothetical protein